LVFVWWQHCNILAAGGIGTVKSQVMGHNILKQAYITLLLTCGDRIVMSSEEKKQYSITAL
jgi:hypothetical protein